MDLEFLTQRIREERMWFISPTVEQTRARDRAVELLKSWLSPYQLAEYNETGAFHVIGEKTLNKYRIESADTAFNVHLLTEGGATRRKLCFVCKPVEEPLAEPYSPMYRSVPAADTMLAQKIMLEKDEAEALRIANFTQPAPTESGEGW